MKCRSKKTVVHQPGFISRQELARILGIHPKSLWYWHSKDRFPDPQVHAGTNVYDVREVIYAIENNFLRVAPSALAELKRRAANAAT